MNYELWDTEAAFMLGRFASEREAQTFVRVVLDTEGDEHAAALELVIGDDGAQNLSGDKLRRWARALDHTSEASEARRPDFYGSRLAGPVKTAAGLSDRAIARSASKGWSPSKALGTAGSSMQRADIPAPPNPIHGQQRDSTVARRRTQPPKKG